MLLFPAVNAYFYRVLQIYQFWLLQNFWCWVKLGSLRKQARRLRFLTYSFITSQLKKTLSRRKLIKLLGSKEQGQEESQIGQLLYYLLTVQQRSLQLFLTPAKRQNKHTQPLPLLGIFMAEGKVRWLCNIIFISHDELLNITQVTPVVAIATNTTGGDWEIKFQMGESLDFCSSRLFHIVKLSHTFMSTTATWHTLQDVIHYLSLEHTLQDVIHYLSTLQDVIRYTLLGYCVVQHARNMKAIHTCLLHMHMWTMAFSFKVNAYCVTTYNIQKGKAWLEALLQNLMVNKNELWFLRWG